MSESIGTITQGDYQGGGVNWMAAAASALPAAAIGVQSLIAANSAKKDAKKQQLLVDNLVQNYMDKPVVNPYSNLPVATQAAEFQAQETDKALANTLDTLRATGASAGGATALAQAAAKSKQKISADIEKQEVKNAQLEAKGEELVQKTELEKSQLQMDYEQSKADQLAQQQQDYMERAATSFGQLGELGMQYARKTGGGGEKTIEGID